MKIIIIIKRLISWEKKTTNVEESSLTDCWSKIVRGCDVVEAETFISSLKNIERLVLSGHAASCQLWRQGAPFRSCCCLSVAQPCLLNLWFHLLCFVNRSIKESPWGRWTVTSRPLIGSLLTSSMAQTQSYKSWCVRKNRWSFPPMSPSAFDRSPFYLNWRSGRASVCTSIFF